MSHNTNIEKVSVAIEAAINECGIRNIAALPKFLQAVKMAQGIKALRDALTREFVQSTLMPLQGTALGFLTDLDSKGGYGWEVVRDCCIEAMLRGFAVVGNEMNIIAGRFYGTKAGFGRQVADFPGLVNLVLQPGVPQLVGDKGALVPFSASWTLQGQPMRIDCQVTKECDLRIPVKVNAGMGSDAILGKAERKMLFRIYQRINGSTLGLVDGEVGDAEPILTTGEPAPSPVPPGTPEGRRFSLKGKGGKSDAKSAVASRETSGAAATPDASETNLPPSSATASAAPEGSSPEGAPVDIVELHEALAQVDDSWSERGLGGVIAGWTEEQRLAAFTWVKAVLHDGPMQIQARRPAHTLITRQPGEDG